MHFVRRLFLTSFGIFFLFAFIMSQFKVVSGTEEPEPVATEIEYEFSDRRVLVVLDRESSLDFKTYCNDDFPEVDCESIINLTPETERNAKESIQKGNTNVSYNKILCLELKNPNQGNTVIDAIARLNTNEHVLCAEPDFTITPCDTTPNDTFYDHQWGHEKINLPSAWDEETGSSSVYVGVVDSGIEGTHPEFNGKIKTEWCMSFLTGTGVSETSPTDLFGHGTHVAGIIGAAGNNNSGVCGVCWNVKLVSLKVFDSDGNGSSSYVISAIDYAESMSIPILNLSLTTSNNNALKTAIDNYSGLVVCAAGNQGRDIDSNPTYPACFPCSNIIAVGNSDSNDNVASSSNYGALSVDIFAPGQDVLSTYPLSICSPVISEENSHHFSTGYHTKSGTSIATPYVTGVAALIKSCHPNLTTAEIKNSILNNGDSCSLLSDKCVTGCRLNAYNALHSIHSFTTYVDYGSAYYHKTLCSICGLQRTTLSLHIWIPNALHTKYTCNKCGATTTHPSLPREE